LPWTVVTLLAIWSPTIGKFARADSVIWRCSDGLSASTNPRTVKKTSRRGNRLRNP